MISNRWLHAAAPVGLLLALSGCKQEKAPEADSAPPGAAKKITAVDEGPTRQDVRSGIGKMLPSVQRHDASLGLQEIAKLYSIDWTTGTPPKKVEDLKGLNAEIVKAVKDGVYVVLWNAKSGAPGTAIVAYEKDVPTKGGMVADLNASVRRMTAQEFQAAPKADKP
jgi:hypothetical protein